MNNLTISIFGNQIFVEIAEELKLFSKFTIKYYDNIDLCIDDAKKNTQILIFFETKSNQEDYKKVLENNFPLVVINKSSVSQNMLQREFVEQLNIPFNVLYLEKKIVSLIAKYEFKKSSLINLRGYIINKNERKIIKNDLELQLTEREINFLILFTENNEPISKNFVLKKIWKYSSESNTHTVETHIHRLRKKILEKFGDNEFIKNNEKGYYI